MGIQTITVKTWCCTRCGAADIRRNGFNQCGNAQFRCLACGRYGVPEPKVAYTEDRKAEIIRAYQERGSLRGMQRRYGVVPETLSGWLKKKLCTPLSETLAAAAADDVLELDEMWTLVGRKASVVWLWLALCRRTRQIVAYHLGDRSDAACTEFRAQLPRGYADLPTFSDRWSADAAVFDPDTDRSCTKSQGQTNHVERAKATMRHHSGRLTRKTLSFSRAHTNHRAAIHAFLLAYNRRCAQIECLT